MDVLALERRVSQLQSELEEKDKDLITAAEFGKKLLDGNQELQNRLEEISKEYTVKIESLEQEKYSLNLKLDRHKANTESLQHELETSRSWLEQDQARKLQRLEEVCSKKVHDAGTLTEELKLEVEKLEVQVKSYQEKMRRQEDVIEQLNEDLSQKTNTTVMQYELKDLEEMCLQEKALREELEMRIMDAEATNEMLHVESSSLAHRVESLEEECEERSRQANTWYDGLQEAKEQVVDLTGQLEMMKMDMMGDPHGRSGNSLFGEVEDRRMDAERKLITIQVKYETLEKTHTTTRHLLKKMKAEMSALLCQYGASTADAAQVQRLQRALDQSRSENQTLYSKLHKLEKQQSDVASVHEKRKCMAAFMDFGDKKEYIHFLEKELEQAKSDKSSILRELDMKRTQLLWETNKLSDTEARLHHSEQERAMIRKEVTKLRMRLQETMEKVIEAQGVCKQLEGEKKLLEDQIKSRDRRGADRHRSQANSRRSSRSLHAANDGSLQTSLSAADDLSSQSLKESDQKQDEDTENTAPPPRPQVKKDINLLDELEREFSKQDQGGDQQAPWFNKPTSPSKNRASVLKLHAEVTVNSKNSKPDPRPQSNAAPSKIVHVKKSDVNQCPQQ